MPPPLLRARGYAAQYLDGGFEAWRAQGGRTAPLMAPTRWVTRERPKIDRIACPWLIRRFLDPAAEFFYVPNAEVRAFAAANGATAYDIPDVPYSHVGPAVQLRCLHPHPWHRRSGARRLADIVRGADTGELGLARAGARPARGVARPVGDDRGRPCDAALGIAGLRRALCVVPQGGGRNARLEPGAAADMSAEGRPERELHPRGQRTQ